MKTTYEIKEETIYLKKGDQVWFYNDNSIERIYTTLVDDCTIENAKHHPYSANFSYELGTRKYFVSCLDVWLNRELANRKTA